MSACIDLTPKVEHDRLRVEVLDKLDKREKPQIVDATNKRNKQAISQLKSDYKNDISRLTNDYNGLEINNKLNNDKIDDLYNQVNNINQNTFDVNSNIDKQIDDKLNQNNQMQNKQFDELRRNQTDINNKVDNLPDLKDITLGVAGLDIFRQILNKPTGGVSTCQAPTLIPPVAAQTRSNNVAILGFQAANSVQNVAIQNTVNAVSNAVGTVQNTLSTMQNFASTAWKATRADKIMNGISMAMTIHNGMMLSNNLFSTVSEALNMSLNAVGIRDETDTPIDIGAAVRGKIQSILTSLIGAENYTALTARIAKANRIYQTGINVLDTTYSLFDSARTVAELTAENTGKIGNALRESGAVYEDAYDEFLEKVNPQNASMRRLGKLRDSVENVEEVFSTINQVASEVVEFQETASQLRAEKAALAEEIDEAIAEELELKEQEKLENTTTADIAEDAFDTAAEVIARDDR